MAASPRSPAAVVLLRISRIGDKPMTEAAAMATVLPDLFNVLFPGSAAEGAGDNPAEEDTQHPPEDNADASLDPETNGADATQEDAPQERPLLIPAEVHRDILDRIERMSLRRVTEKQRARERQVLASVAAAQQRGHHTPADPVARKLARLRALAKAAYKTTGWVGVGHVLAVGIARMDQALDFAEVAEQHPKHFWPAFTALFHAHRAGTPKRNPAGWLRSAAAAAAKNADSGNVQGRP